MLTSRQVPDPTELLCSQSIRLFLQGLTLSYSAPLDLVTKLKYTRIEQGEGKASSPRTFRADGHQPR